MSIVRSLLIKIGFASDKNTENKANKSIDNLKKRYLLLSSAAAYAFSRISSFFGDLATATLDANDLSKALGISLKEFSAMQMAAGKVARISQESFQGLFTNLNKMFVDFKTGSSTQLQDIARNLEFEVDRVNDNGASLFNKILTGLSKVQNEQERIRIASNIFGEDLGVKISNLATHINEFTQSVDDFQDLGQKVEDSLGSLERYDDAVRALGQAWKQFVIEISQDVLPILQFLIDHMKEAFGLIKGVGQIWKGVFQLDLEQIKAGAQTGSKALDPLFEATFLGGIRNWFQRLWSGEVTQPIVDYIENREGYQYNPMRPAMAGAPNVTVNNEISVPPGTTEEQAQFMADSIQRTVDESIQSTFRQIQYNNPVVE